MKRYYILFLLLALNVLLVACGVDVDKSNVSASPANNSEINIETTDDSYSDEIYSFSYDLVEYTSNVYSKIMKKEDYNKDELIKLSNEFILYVQSVENEPVTEQDKMAKKHFDSLLFNSEKLADYTLQYLYKGDDFYKKTMKNYYNDIIKEVGLLQAIYE